MQYQIKPSSTPVHKKITIPGSKSITNRALLLAALAKGTSHLSGMLFSDDTFAFINALTNLGIHLTYDSEKNTAEVHGCAGRFPNQYANIDCKDAGTAARFLVAACANSPGKFSFDGSPRLRARPLSALLEVLAAQGASYSNNSCLHMPFTLQGTHGIKGGKIFIPGHQSSQFLSALLMIAPYAKKEVWLQTHDLVSRPYINLTCRMMREFGVTVEQKGVSDFYIPTSQCYQAQNYQIEPDLSTASYFFAAAAITAGKITIPNIDRNHCKQGDIGFLTILENMGCTVESHDGNTTVIGTKPLNGITVDMNDISDTFMTLACLAPFANSPTTIHNIAHTRLQESDRIQSVANNLSQMGVPVSYGEDFITITPSKPKPTLIESYNDHRIAMAFSLIGLVVPGVVINGMECVAKTCPEFTSMWESLASDID